MTLVAMLRVGVTSWIVMHPSVTSFHLFRRKGGNNVIFHPRVELFHHFALQCAGCACTLSTMEFESTESIACTSHYDLNRILMLAAIKHVAGNDFVFQWDNALVQCRSRDICQDTCIKTHHTLIQWMSITLGQHQLTQQTVINSYWTRTHKQSALTRPDSF